MKNYRDILYFMAVGISLTLALACSSRESLEAGNGGGNGKVSSVEFALKTVFSEDIDVRSTSSWRGYKIQDEDVNRDWNENGASVKSAGDKAGAGDRVREATQMSRASIASVASVAGAATRAKQELGRMERFIGDVWVVQLAEDGTRALCAPVYVPVLESTGRLRVELIEEPSKVFFFANTQNTTLFDHTAPLTEFTLERVSQVQMDFTDGSTIERTIANPVKGIPMAGLWSGTPSAQNGIMEAVPMVRSVAKLRFSVAAKLPAGERFTPTSLQLCRVPRLLYYYRDPRTLTLTTSPKAQGVYFDYPSQEMSGQLGATPKEFTWYLPENARGISPLTTSQKDKSAYYVPQGSGDYATCIVITGDYVGAYETQTVRYTIFPGADNVRDYNILRNHSYNITAVILGKNALDMRVEGSEIPPEEKGGVRANCAIVKPGQSVELDVLNRVKMCAVATPSVMLPWAAGTNYTPLIIWQDQVGLIASMQYNIEKAAITIATDLLKGSGNALVGLFPEGTTDPASGTCIWSWHIWVTPYDPDAVVRDMKYAPSKNSAYGQKNEQGQVHCYGEKFMATNPGMVIMDRNLGATKTYYSPPPQGDLQAPQCFGLMYQWGRKDPFPGWDGVKATPVGTPVDVLKTYDGQGYPTDYPRFTSGVADVLQTAKNPYNYYKPSPISQDWSPVSYATYWNQGSLTMPLKTVYDPCPQGWRVPINGTWDDFYRNISEPESGTFPYYSNGTIFEHNNTNPGPTNGRWYHNVTWYPACGWGNNGYYGQHADIMNVGGAGISISATSAGVSAHGLHYHAQDLQTGQIQFKGFGYNVRCVQEPKY